jgi:hypothetical protein
MEKSTLNLVLEAMPDRSIVLVEKNPLLKSNVDALLWLEKRGIVTLDITEPGPVIVAARLTDYGRDIKNRGGL